MLRRQIVYLGCVVATGIVLTLAACTTDYQMGLEDPKFGAPNALADQRQPGPTSETTSNDNLGTTTPECVRAGGALIDGGACAVSFKTDILGAFRGANCQTAGSCHGGTTPPNLPRIEPDDPNMWAEFAGFKLTNGTPYINPCSTDKTKSSIACNVNKAAPCGSLMPPGVGLPAEVVTKIETWLACGSPNN